MSSLLADFHFLRPYWFLAIIPAIAIAWFLRRTLDPRFGLTDGIAPHLLDRLVSQPKDRPKVRPAVVLLPLTLLAIVSLAGPSFQRQPSPFAEDQSQLMIVVKMTPSMKTADLQPSRLERCRIKLHDLFQLRSGAATGLVAYSGSAHLVMPPTSDSDVIDHMLEALDPAIMPSEGDALAKALDMAAQTLASQKVGRSILVVADSVSGTELDKLATWREANPFTVQTLVPLRSEDALKQSGIPQAAKAMNSSVQLVTPAEDDIKRLASGADRAIVTSVNGEDLQWKDEGYTLVPFLVLGLLLWCRRGWSLGKL